MSTGAPLIDGLLAGLGAVHKIREGQRQQQEFELQKQQVAQHQQNWKQQQDQEQRQRERENQYQDATRLNIFQQLGRPVIGGMVSDEGNLPQISGPESSPIGSAMLDSGNPMGARGAMPTGEGTSYKFFRQVDPERLRTLTTQEGQKHEIEMYSQKEQRDQAIRDAAELAKAKSDQEIQSKIDLRRAQAKEPPTQADLLAKAKTDKIAHDLANPPEKSDIVGAPHITTDDKGNQNLVTQHKDGTVTETPLKSKGKTKTLAASGAGVPGSSPDDPKLVAQGIMEGKQPPTLAGLYRNGLRVRAELQKQGYDLMGAQRDWAATQKHMATMNGPQQERLRQAITFTSDSVDNIDKLYDEWNALGRSGPFKLFNKATLAAAKHMGGKAGEIATALDTQINDLTSELGTVYAGGNTSTDHSLSLASSNLKGEWDEPTFKRAVGQIRTNVRMRRNSINTSAPQGVSAGSPYVPKSEAAAPAKSIDLTQFEKK